MNAIDSSWGAYEKYVEESIHMSCAKYCSTEILSRQIHNKKGERKKGKEKVYYYLITLSVGTSWEISNVESNGTSSAPPPPLAVVELCSGDSIHGMQASISTG